MRRILILLLAGGLFMTLGGAFNALTHAVSMHRLIHSSEEFVVGWYDWLAQERQEALIAFVIFIVASLPLLLAFVKLVKKEFGNE